MASAGLHSSAVALFLVFATVLQPVIAPQAKWRPELLFLCLYVLCLGGLVEYRNAQLFSARRLGGPDEEARRGGKFSRKSSSRDPEYTAMATQERVGQFGGFQEVGTLGPYAGSGSYIVSDGELASPMMGPPLVLAEEPAPPAPPDAAARPALAGLMDRLPARLLPTDWSPRSLLSDYVLSRFMPHGGGHSPRPSNASKLQSPQVPMVAASSHDAPDFPDSAFLPAPPRPAAASSMTPFGTRQDLSESPPKERPADDAQSRPEAKKEMPTELRALKLGGFNLRDLNALFIEVHDPKYELNGFPSYWSKSGSHFLYYDRELMTWAISVGKVFQQTRNGESHYVALGPEGYWDVERLRGKGWRERNATTGQMPTTPSKKAVVETLGKVKPPAARKTAKPA